MDDLSPSTALMVMVLAALLPLAAIRGTVMAWSSSGSFRGVGAGLLAVLAAALAYLHPLAQEALNQAHLGPKLERARALDGEGVERLILELGEPEQVVLASAPSSYSYASYGPAWWTPFAWTELVVPLSKDGGHVSVIAHFAD